MASIVEALLFAMLVGAFVCVFYSWGEWLSHVRSERLFGWRGAAVTVGVFSVTVQAILFLALWSPVSRHHSLLLKCMYADFALILLGVPCIFALSGTIRWALLASTLFLPVACFFAVLAELAY
jgi:hypothetical protein